MKLLVFFSAEMQDSSIKCFNRADFGDRMKHLKISKLSTRNNFYHELNITNEAILCQNKPIRLDDLCIDKFASGEVKCETESKALLDL